MHFNFSQAEMCNGLKSVETICYRAYGSCSSAFQPSARSHIPAWDFNPMRKIEMRPGTVQKRVRKISCNISMLKFLYNTAHCHLSHSSLSTPQPLIYKTIFICKCCNRHNTRWHQPAEAGSKPCRNTPACILFFPKMICKPECYFPRVAEIIGICSIPISGGIFGGECRIIKIGGIQCVYPYLKAFYTITGSQVQNIKTAIAVIIQVVHKVPALVLPFGADPESL